MREIYVAKIENDTNEERKTNIQKLINQLLGIGGMDFVDCVVMMVSDIDRQGDIYTARAFKNLKHGGQNIEFQPIQLRNAGLFARL